MLCSGAALWSWQTLDPIQQIRPIPSTDAQRLRTVLLARSNAQRQTQLPLLSTIQIYDLIWKPSVTRREKELKYSLLARSLIYLHPSPTQIPSHSDEADKFPCQDHAFMQDSVVLLLNHDVKRRSHFEDRSLRGL